LAIGTLGLGKGRIEALTDGIFATVMTVLVLSLSIPTITATGNGVILSRIELEKYVFGLGPIVLSYVLSFLILAVFWVRHHNMFHFLTKVNNAFIWLNITFLLSIGFIPFSTELLGRYPTYEISNVIYGSNLIATGLTMQAIWYYSTRNNLVSDGIDERAMSLINRRLLVGPFLYLFAILVSLAFGTDYSLIIYGLSLVYYVLASSTSRGLLGSPFRRVARSQSTAKA
jgi:uncharacterized membrane protein